MSCQITILKDGSELIQDVMLLPLIEPRPNPYPIDHKLYNKFTAMENTRLGRLALKKEEAEYNDAIDKAIQPTEPELPPITCTPEEWNEYLKKVDTYKSEMRELGIVGYQTRGRKPFADPSTKKPPRPLTRNKNIKVLEEAGFTVDDTDVKNIVVHDGHGRTFKMLINGKIDIDSANRVSVYTFLEKYKRREI